VSDPAGLLATARRLAQAGSTRPRQSDLKRSISTSYYALFHAVARSNADRIVGTGQGRSDRAWTQAYRALEHGNAKAACQQLGSLGFPAGLVRVGRTFVSLQEARHSADYDPNYRVSRRDALSALSEAEAAIAELRRSSVPDRAWFAVQLLMRRR
jgi:hypothetical protein